MTTYYVRSDADAGGDGTTTNTTGGTCAWNSIAQVNAKNFSSGDVVYFRPGDTFDDVTLTLAGISSAITGITISSSDFGGRTVATNGLPWLDHDSIETYIQNSNISDLTFKDLNCSGLGINSNKRICVRFANIEDLTIDGIYLQGDYGTPVASSVGQNGMFVETSCSGIIEVKNCEIFNIGPTDASGNLDLFSTAIDCVGFYTVSPPGATLYIHDNVIHDTQSDNIMIYTGPLSDNTMTYIYNNELYNGGENNIDVKGYSNVEIYDNEFYRTAGFTGHLTSPVVQIVVHEASGVADTLGNVKIHDNYFHDHPYISGHDVQSIRLGSVSDAQYTNVEVYNNIFDNTYIAISIGNYIVDWYIHNNVFLNQPSRAITVNASTAGDRYIVNNTMVRGTETSGVSAIYMDYSNEDVIRNNVVEWGGSSANCLTVTTSGTAPTVDNNIWHNPDNTTKLTWLGTNYTESNWSTWEASHDNDSYADPTLLSTGRLDTGSPAFGAGVIVAGVNDVGKLDMWGNAPNDSPNMGADFGSDQNVTSIDTGFAFNEASYIVRVEAA